MGKHSRGAAVLVGGLVGERGHQGAWPVSEGFAGGSKQFGLIIESKRMKSRAGRSSLERSLVLKKSHTCYPSAGVIFSLSYVFSTWPFLLLFLRSLFFQFQVSLHPVNRMIDSFFQPILTTGLLCRASQLVCISFNGLLKLCQERS